jgi:vacuolar-type H+-ATPase subunit H
LSVHIKELQELIEEEKAAEERVRRTREETQNILKAAHERAESIVQAVESDPSWEKLREAGAEEILKRKAEMEEEYKQEISVLNSTAEQNFEKAVAYVVKKMLGAEI